MTRSEFLNVLYRNLDGLPEDERNSIMLDYEEHFDEALADGKTENQIAKELGHPGRLAKEHRATYSYARAKHNPTTSNIFQAIIAVIGLSILNFFIISIPLIIYISIALSMAIMALMFICSPLFLGLDYLINGIEAVSWFEGFMVVMLVGAGLVLIPATYYLVKFGNHILMKYVRWNISTVRGATNR